MPVFFFTDIEGSTEKWEKFPEGMKKILSQHDHIIKTNIEKFGGRLIKHTGDGVFAVFDEGQPLHCALAIQKMIESESWGEIGELRIRIGLHAGPSDKRGDDYFGPVVNRTARVMAAAWGGQVICTPAVANSVVLPEKATLKDLGAHLLKDLGEPQPIYQLIHPELKLQEFPPLRSLSSSPNNLPIQNTPFLGRKNELTEIIKLLKDPSCRLLTLIGPGGTGKTRIALQAAAEKIEYFSNGVYFIPLAPLSSVELLISTIAKVLKFSFYSREDEKTQLLNYLREKEMLLIMDNFEHLIEGAGILAEILNIAQNVKILVTSRELLNLKGEWVFQVEGLEVPQGERIDIGEYSAVQLFLYNAQRVNAKFDLSGEDRKFVLKICQLVGGLPLGIELASAWLRALSPREIASEIEKNIDFLATRMRDIPERHRSLRAAFEYSWQLLKENEKIVLQKLSVFAGNFNRAEAEYVAGASLPVLSSLVDKSLLRKNANGYYKLLEVVRQFASEKLVQSRDEYDATRKAFCEYFAEFLAQREDDIESVNNAQALHDIGIEIENLRSVWNLMIENKLLKEINKAVVSLFRFYSTQGWFQEGKTAIEKAIKILSSSASVPDIEPIYGRVLRQYGALLYNLGMFEEATSAYKQSLQIAEETANKKEIAESINALGNIDVVLGKFKSANEYYDKSRKIFKEINDIRGMIGGYNNQGVLHFNLKEYDEAKRLYTECLNLSKKAGYERGIGMAVANIGLIAYELGEYHEAKLRLLQGLEIDKRLDSKIGIANSYHNLGLITKALGDYGEARKYYEQGLAIRKEVGDRMGIATSYNNLGNLHARLKNFERSQEYHMESLKIREEMGDKLGIAQSFINLNSVSIEFGDYEKAKSQLMRALELSIEMENIVSTANTLVEYSKYLHAVENTAKAYEILYFLKNYDVRDRELREEIESFFKRVKKKIPEEMIEKVSEKFYQGTLLEYAQLIYKEKGN